jgi:phosphatidylserine decarboxylase
VTRVDSRDAPGASSTAPPQSVAPPTPHPLAAGLFVALQHLLPQHTLSRAILARSRAPVVRNALIRAFMYAFRPAVEESVQPEPLAYGSFNDFFTRALRAGARPLAPEPQAVLSPVDGTVSQIGDLDERQLLQAKGHRYGLDELLGGPTACGAELAGGVFATLYLAPYNYHRIHMPLTAAPCAAWYVPGRLFSVNAHTVAARAGLFARNERVVLWFQTRGGSHFAMVLVGALFVGSIATVWHGEVTPRRPRRRLELALPQDAAPLTRGEEMGRFNMGSTVILLFPPGTVRLCPELRAGSRLNMGQAIGHWIGP